MHSTDTPLAAADASPTTPQIHDVEPATLREWLDEGKAVLFDVREPDENLRERIDGAILNPLSRFESSRVPPPNGSVSVLHCRSRVRSREAAQKLLASGHSEAYALKGGIEAWKAAGFPTQRTRVPISIMRQVQITVGFVVLLTALLAAFHSPWWLVATGCFGAGLLFAGATGTCALATMLGSMPWNRGFRKAASCDSGAGCTL